LLAALLRAQGAPAPARAILRRALRRDPGNFGLTSHLAMSYHLDAPADAAEAIRFYSAALAVRQEPGVLINLAMVLGSVGRINEARTHLQHALTLQPDHAGARQLLATCLVKKGRMGEAIAALRALVRQRGRAWDFHQLGCALYQANRIDQSALALRQAVRLQPDFPEALIMLGSVLVRQDRLRAARDALRRAREAAVKAKSPALELAHQSLAAVDALLGLEARLPAILRGEDKPPAGNEWTVPEMCAAKGLNVAATRRYEEIITGNPKLLADRNMALGLRCACTAALAGCGRGQDAAGLSGAERARWRGVALRYLRKELEVWGKEPRVQGEQRLAAENGVRTWLYDPALGGVREPAALAKLPAEERKEWRRLWADVGKFLQEFRDDP
jgi:Flp pilus assembly protein TadD